MLTFALLVLVPVVVSVETVNLDTLNVHLAWGSPSRFGQRWERCRADRAGWVVVQILRSATIK
jgi:hypothetical protein